MTNRKKSKSEMKKIYFMRRLIALLILALIVVLIATRCGKTDSDPKENSNKTQNQILGENQVEGNVSDPNLENQKDQNKSPDQEDNLNQRLEEEEEKLQKDYQTYAEVSLEKENKTYHFSLKDDYKDLVENRENPENQEDFNQFWENFKFKLKESSTKLTEFIEPGIELQVLDPKDKTTVILMISDGAELFDRTSE
ncbi:MAG: hypothetical protein Q4E36_00795 [Bacillota bacterium]|nr:hypothetical protein [Bacillota bacterium]